MDDVIGAESGTEQQCVDHRVKNFTDCSQADVGHSTATQDEIDQLLDKFGLENDYS